MNNSSSNSRMCVSCRVVIIVMMQSCLCRFNTIALIVVPCAVPSFVRDLCRHMSLCVSLSASSFMFQSVRILP